MSRPTRHSFEAGCSAAEGAEALAESINMLMPVVGSPTCTRLGGRVGGEAWQWPTLPADCHCQTFHLHKRLSSSRGSRVTSSSCGDAEAGDGLTDIGE